MVGVVIPRQQDGLIHLAVNPATGSGVNVLLASPGADIRIMVCQLVINCNAGANSIRFQSEQDTNISPLWEFADLGGLVLPYNKNGWFKTVAAEDLTCVLTVASAVGILIGYRLTTY